MEALYQSFTQIPIHAVSSQGLVLMIFISGAFIFKFVMPKPKKKKNPLF